MSNRIQDTVLLTFFFLVGAIAYASAVPNEADYPTQYSVVNTMKTSGIVIGNFCTMSLRNEATPNLLYVVQKKGHGRCHAWDAGTVLRGHREKKSIHLLVIDDKGELRVEDWPIVSTSDTGRSLNRRPTNPVAVVTTQSDAICVGS